MYIRFAYLTLILFFLSNHNVNGAYADEQYDMQYYIDCGINEGSVKGGEFSKYDLDCWCNEIKEERSRQTWIYTGIGIGALVLVIVLISGLNKTLSNKTAFTKLEESINSVFLTLIEVENNVSKSSTLEERTSLKSQLISLDLIAEEEIFKRAQDYKWDPLKPIIIPSMSTNSTTLGIALNKVSQKIKELKLTFD